MLPQNPVIQPEKTDYGEVALKVPKPRKSDRLQRKSEQPLNPARSFYKQIRKKLSCPATQIRIFLSVVLIFGTVLTIGYVMSSETLEHGANRNLKGLKSMAKGIYRSIRGKKQGSKRASVAENAENAENVQNGGNGENVENAGNTARLKTITSSGKSTALVTYDAKKKTIDIIGKGTFTIDENTWLSQGTGKRGDARYDALVDVLNANNNSRSNRNNNTETVYLKAMKGKDAKSGRELMETIKKGLSGPSTANVTLNLSLQGLEFQKTTTESEYDTEVVYMDGWYVKKVYNTVMEQNFSKVKGKFKSRAYGEEVSQSDSKLVCNVPVSPAQLLKPPFKITVEFSGSCTQMCTFWCSKTGDEWTAALSECIPS